MGAPEISRNFSPAPNHGLPGALAFDLGWARIALLPAAPYTVCDQPPTHVLGLAFERQRGVHAVGGERRRDFDAWPGDLACTAPGVDMFSESPQGGEYLTLHVAGDALADPGDLHSNAPRTIFHGHRPALRLGWQLRRLMLAPAPRLPRIEALAAQLLGSCEALLSQPRQPPGAYAADRPRHARVLEHIDAALDTPLPLQDLAALAQMPLLRFLRSFTGTFGCTPHAYVTERRLQRARALLSRSSGKGCPSIAAIAADCGFAHQSHLGAALKARLGMTPVQYRARSR